MLDSDTCEASLSSAALHFQCEGQTSLAGLQPHNGLKRDCGIEIPQSARIAAESNLDVQIASDSSGEHPEKVLRRTFQSLRQSATNIYGNVDKITYMERRKLMPAYGNSIHVWGFVVGAVISGEVSGFNAGYGYGLGSMIVAHAVGTVLMITVSLNLTDLAASLPFASGCAGYANAAFNGVIACLIGYAYTLDVIFIGGEVTNFLGVSLQNLFHTDKRFNYLYWIISIIVCMTINYFPKVSMNTMVVTSMLSCVCVITPLLVLAWSSTGFSFQFIVNGSSFLEPALASFLPFGIVGVVRSFPFSWYLLICFESMPSCVEETRNVGVSVPRGMFASVSTLLILSWTVLLCCAGFSPGPSAIDSANFPFITLLTARFGASPQQLFTLISIPPIFASQLSIFYACTRYIYGQSRGGYMPPILSLTTSQGAPYTAMIATAAMWAALSSILEYVPEAGAVFLDVGTLFALTAYIVQPLVYLQLQRVVPSLTRPFKTPYGTLVAGINFAIGCTITTALLIVDNNYRIYAAFMLLGYLILSLFYYFIIQHYLTDSPEKMFIRRQVDKLLIESLVASGASQHVEAVKKLRRKGTGEVTLLRADQKRASSGGPP
ncbi:amino acid permease-domain-containing protein [Chytriomyces sp. MP71]|nr:amino acid permease-domain-containing protein [Chytriomyces sp. MP71]